MTYFGNPLLQEMLDDVKYIQHKYKLTDMQVALMLMEVSKAIVDPCSDILNSVGNCSEGEEDGKSTS